MPSPLGTLPELTRDPLNCYAEDALACPELPVELRQELRRWLALYAYVTSDPDWNPRGAGVHLGNNNMPINRTLALAYFAGLLPDHPRYAYWMDCLKTFTEFKLATYFSPGGESLECPSYSTYAPAGALNIAQNVLRHRGIADLTANGATRGYLEYMANLTMPDPRFGGARIIPGMGNSANDMDSIWGTAVATFLDQDPEFAGWCKAMFKAAGSKFLSTSTAFVGHPMYYLPDVPETPLQFETIFMPAYGVAFRSQAGTSNETAMLLRAGVNWGHWDTDALNVILYGKEAPLSPGTGYQYLVNPAPQQDNGIYHNRVKVGQRDLQEVFGRVDCAIADYAFAPQADYAVADRYYPPKIFTDEQGEMHWRRHVLFLKGREATDTSYFVMRDTFPGGEDRPKWWSWLNLDDASLITVDGQGFDLAQVPINQAVPEEQFPSLRGQTVEMKTKYGASTWFWFSRPVDVRIRMTFDYPRQDGQPGKETKTIVEIPAAAGEDFFCVVWPRRDGETPPACQLLSPGVIQIKTATATDYAFIDEVPIVFDREGVEFKGKAGAVRRHVNKAPTALLAVADKPHQAADLGRGVIVSGELPFEATLDGETIRIKTQGRARVLYVTQPPFIIRPQYWIDGQEHMASWTDYPASGWGSYKNTWLMALPVPEGEHELVVKDYVFPPVWERPFTPLLSNPQRQPANPL